MYYFFCLNIFFIYLGFVPLPRCSKIRPIIMRPLFKILLLLFVLVQTALYAFPSDGPLKIQFNESEMVLDGKLMETSWAGATSLPVITHSPNYLAQPSEKTEIYLLHDQQYLYVGAKLYAKDPATIQTTSKKRDDFSFSNDWFGILIDSYNDNENALGFFTTPAGLRMDMAIYEDAIGEFPINLSWNAFWDVAVSQDLQGWYVEMRIPFSSLRFQSIEDIVTMGVVSWRWIPHHNELVSFPSLDPAAGEWAFVKPSLGHDVQLHNVPNRRPVYVSAYALAGYSHTHELNEQETAYTEQEKPTTEAGLDVKYSLTSNLTLDLTLNTDFAQVEADDQQVNLTRFSLFFPEKRQFFQERSSVFDIRVGGPARLFYTRRIGLNEDGDEPIRILAGARLVGRVGKFDLGFMDMQTEGGNGMHSENLSVLRLRKQVFNQYSYLGGIATNRLDFKGGYNSMYGLDGIFRLFGNDYLKVRWAQSFEQGKPNQALSLKPSRVFVNWEKVQDKGFTYDLSYGSAGGDWNPGLGFELREDFTSAWYVFGYTWLPEGDQSKFFKYGIESFNNFYLRNQYNLRESTWNSLGFWFETKKGWTGSLSGSYRQERVFEAYEISEEVEIPVGDYGYWETALELAPPFAGKLYVQSQLTAGQFFDGERISISLMPRWNISSSLEMRGGFEWNYLKFNARNIKVNAQVARINLLYMFNTKFTLSCLVQYNSTGRLALGNFRLRYNPKEGNDLYFVVNESVNTDRYFELPIKPKTNADVFVVKYTHTFQW